MTAQKVLSISELAEKSLQLQKQGMSVVLCHGTFDLMHTGHIRYLQRAKQEGDVLLVTVTGDAFVNKGPGRPVFNEHLRAENLAALACVDLVAVNQAATAVELLHEIRPDLYVKGSDYQSHSDDVTGNIAREQEAVEAHGGRIFYTDEIVFSSSSLLNEHFGLFPPATKEYLNTFREKWSDIDVHDMLESLSGLRVLVIGDAIIDQYHYTSPLGQTGKGNTLAVHYKSEEQFAGGAIAVANHLASFADQVTLVTGLGTIDSQEEFIRLKLLDNIEPNFFYMEGAPTIIKRRFADADLSKLPPPGGLADRQMIAGSPYFHKRKFLTTSNGKNFVLAGLGAQQDYFDELDEFVHFPPVYTAALLSCGLLEKARQEGYDFEADPVVYTSHQISVDRRLQRTLRSNDRLHLLIEGPLEVSAANGLGKAGRDQQRYHVFGVLDRHVILFRAKVQMAALHSMLAATE